MGDVADMPDETGGRDDVAGGALDRLRNDGGQPAFALTFNEVL